MVEEIKCKANVLGIAMEVKYDLVSTILAGQVKARDELAVGFLFCNILFRSLRLLRFRGYRFRFTFALFSLRLLFFLSRIFFIVRWLLFSRLFIFLLQRLDFIFFFFVWITEALWVLLHDNTQLSIDPLHDIARYVDNLAKGRLRRITTLWSRKHNLVLKV